MSFRLWPETYRALVVQSARWPEPIRSRLIGRGKSWKAGKAALAERRAVLRQAGFGVPQLDAAIASAKNDFTMIAQAEIQPYAAGANGGPPVYNAIHFYDLPWPQTALADLKDKAVTLRVTLSYFIEPNLTGKGATRPETYRSFGLRFTMKKRDETEEEFRSRLSQREAAAEQEDEALDEDENEVLEAVADEGDGQAEDKKKIQTSKWLIGPGAVSAGSLHCDIWRGKASDLVDHDAIAVHPAPGWWKSHGGKRRFGDSGRYASCCRFRPTVPRSTSMPRLQTC